MTNTQRIIKYIAMAFAIFLVFSILSSIMFGIMSVTNIFSDNKTDNLEKINISNNSSILDIEVSRINVIIKRGNEFKAETNNKYIKTRQNGNKLYITEKNHSIFSNDNSDLVVYVPSDYIFDSVSIESGAGRIDIESLSCKKLYLDLGAGKVDINNLLVLNETKIDGGAGTITIEDSSLNSLDLDMGMGKLSLTSKINGESEIDAGVGEVDLNLIGTMNDYKIKLDGANNKLKNYDDATMQKHKKSYRTTRLYSALMHKKWIKI